jgi:hypothetical protein
MTYIDVTLLWLVDGLTEPREFPELPRVGDVVHTRRGDGSEQPYSVQGIAWVETIPGVMRPVVKLA